MKYYLHLEQGMDADQISEKLNDRFPENRSAHRLLSVISLRKEGMLFTKDIYEHVISMNLPKHTDCSKGTLPSYCT